jgi:hypothetical protein
VRALLMLMKLQVMSVSFCTQERVDVEPSNIVKLKPEEVNAVKDEVV